MTPTKPPRVTPHVSEKKLSEACIKRTRDQWHGEVLNVHGGSTAQVSGHPDHLLCVAGRFVGIELKQPGEKPTPLQYKRLRDWRAAGAVVGWATTEVEYDQLVAHAEAGTGWVNNDLETPGAPPI